MANATTKLQVNFKTRSNNPQFASLLNVYADDADDLNTQLQGLIDNLPKISEIEELLGAADVVVNTPPSGQGQQRQAQPAPAAEGDAPRCQHGVMVWKEGTNTKTGKPWKGWFCPSQDRNDQCPVQWKR